MLTKSKHNEWSYIHGGTSRMRVFGGWLIKEETNDVVTVVGDRGGHMNNDFAMRASIIFMPDPAHQWDQWSKEQDVAGTLTELIAPGRKGK